MVDPDIKPSTKPNIAKNIAPITEYTIMPETLVTFSHLTILLPSVQYLY